MSAAPVLVRTVDAATLRAALGSLPGHVRVLVRPTSRVAEGSLVLATPESIASGGLPVPGGRPRLAVFGGGKLGGAVAQYLALVAAETRVAPYLVPDRDALRRLVFARVAGAQDRLIASVALDGKDLVVWSCEPRPHRVAVASIPALARLSPEGLARFEVSESGSRVHWNEGDVDLDLASLRFPVDPAFRRARQREAREEALRYAHAVRVVRERHGLKQSEVPGLSEREVRRVESGERLPRYATLEKLAAAHGLGVDAYLAALARERTARTARRGRTPRAPRLRLP